MTANERSKVTTPGVTALSPRSAEPLILHVIPTPAGRGAQREARALADQLDEPGIRAHRVLALFEGPHEVTPDLSLGFDGGEAPAVGFQPRLVPKLRSALRRLDPAVVVAHGGDPLKYLVPAMAGRHRPLVYYAIGTYAGPRDRRAGLTLWRTLLKRVDLVGAEGPEVRRECIDLFGVGSERVFLAPNGRDPDVFRPRQDGGSDGAPVLTFIGALTDGKRPGQFVEVVTELRRSGFDVRAQIVGDGPLRTALAEPARRADVELLGWRPDIPQILRRSDIMVFPSRAVGEGMPGVLIEAGLSGVPVVATDVPGVRTIVEHDVTGLVVPVDDLSTMITAVEALVQDPPRRAALGDAARMRCTREFSLRAVAATWLDAMAHLLPEPGDRRY